MSSDSGDDRRQESCGAPGELRGATIVLRPTTEADFPTLDRIVREPEVAAWWSVPDDYRDMLAILVDDEVIGAIQFSEETDPEFRHAAIDIFLTTNRHGQGLGGVSPISVDQPAASGAVHHKAELRPRTGCPWVMRQRREVRYQTSQAHGDRRDTP